jgi:short-subunit dehydrogenase
MFIPRPLTVALSGPIRLIKAFLPHFHGTPEGTRTPTIINVSSGAAHFTIPFASLYHASKSAIDLLSEGLVWELVAAQPHHPIAVKVVVPYGGISDTAFFNHLTAMVPLFQDGWASKAPGISETAQADYRAYFDRSMKMFEGMNSLSMPAARVAGRIWEAVTDGKTQLRYFVGPDIGGPILKMRLGREGEGEGVKPDEYFDQLDEKYMAGMRAAFA